MRKLIYTVFASVCMCSCGSSQKIEKSPVQTYVQPCSEMPKSVLRTWAVGKSDSEATARKKAQAMAASQLATQMEQMIENLVDVKNVDVAGTSKDIFAEKAKISVKKALKGTVITCDRWVKDEKTGVYANYIVMEIDRETYLKILNVELEDKELKYDRTLLEKAIEELLDKED